MFAGPIWTHADACAGDCHMSLVGTAKPHGFARIQEENETLKFHLQDARKQLAELSEAASKPDPAMAAELGRMRQQVATLNERLAGTEEAAIRRLSEADREARERLQADQAALDKAKASLADQRAAIESAKASLACQRAAIESDKASLATQAATQAAEVQKWRSHLTAEFASLREREAAMAKRLGLEERQQAILNGDMSSITQSLVADIARLEADVAFAQGRMLAADKAHSSVQHADRQQWHGIYIAASKELRAVRQQLIQLPRASDADPRDWKNALVATIALAMEQGNVPEKTIRDFVARSTGMLAHQAVRKVIANKSAEQLKVRMEQSAPQ